MQKKTPLKNLIIVSLAVGLAFLLRHPAQSQVGNISGLSLTPDASRGDFLLSWSADSYVPPNYKGKALPTLGSQIKVVALPTKMLPQHPDNYYYRWLLDERLAGYANGQGKSIFSFKVSKWSGDSHEVESQILDAQENIIARNFVTIPVIGPELLLNKKNTNQALQDNLAVQTGQEIELLATPLFFNITRLSDLDWQWVFDNEPATDKETQSFNQLILKIPAVKLSYSVQKYLSLQVVNKNNRFQQASIKLNIEIK